jgi:antitoxin VapB
MTLNIEDPEADRLARAVADRTGETIANAVIIALRERLAREEQKMDAENAVVGEAMTIGRHFKSLSLNDDRSVESLLYDENGLPA